MRRGRNLIAGRSEERTLWIRHYPPFRAPHADIRIEAATLPRWTGRSGMNRFPAETREARRP